MNATAASGSSETESVDVEGKFERAEKDRQYAVPPEDVMGTGSPAPYGGSGATPRPTKRVMVGPRQLDSVRFPYSYELEKKKETIRRLNEEMGW